MLLARLAAEKQEVSCQTLLKLEKNSLKVVWPTIRILKNHYREKNHTCAEGTLREPVEEKNQRNCHPIFAHPKGHSQFPAGSLLSLSLSFQMWRSLVMVLGRRWKFQMFLYNWLWGPQLLSEKLLPVVGLLPKQDTVWGLHFFMANKDGSRLSLDSGQAPHVTQVFTCEETWRGSTTSACLCLGAECHLEVDGELSGELSGLLIFWL